MELRVKVSQVTCSRLYYIYSIWHISKPTVHITILKFYICVENSVDLDQLASNEAN